MTIPWNLNKSSMDKELRKLIRKAERKYIEADMALQELTRHLVFDGFEPTISMCNGSELILVYDGAELDANGIIEAMESRGYITKDDFLGL